MGALQRILRFARQLRISACLAGGKPIRPYELDRLIDGHRAEIDAMPPDMRPSFFEVLTALAIRHFVDREVDWAIMEAGLGGVSDATNVFEARQVWCGA